MGNVMPFPITPATTPASLDQLGARFHRRHDRMTVDQLAERLALNGLSPRTIIDRLRTLAEFSDLPLPRNPRVWNGRPVTGPTMICAASLWDRGEVLAWLDHGTPSGGAAQPAHSGTPQSIRDTLRHRASRMVAGSRP